MWKKFGKAGPAADDKIRRLRFACWMTKTADTHSDYVIIISVPLQQWLRERPSMLRCTYIPCLSVRPPVRPSVRLSFRPPVCPSIRPPVRPFSRLSVRSPVCPPVRLSFRPPVLPSSYLSVHPSSRLSARPPVHPNARPSVPRLSVRPPVYPPFHLSVRPSARPSALPSVRPSFISVSIQPSSRPSSSLRNATLSARQAVTVCNYKQTRTPSALPVNFLTQVLNAISFPCATFLYWNRRILY